MHSYLEQLVTVGFLGAMMWGMLKFMLRDIHRDLTDLKEGQKRLSMQMDKAESRIDHLYEENNKLYHILIDMVRKK